MTDFLIQHIEWGVRYAHTWGFLLVFVFMTIESSFVPFPSEVVMIPAGFMAYRSELLFSSPGTDLFLVVLFGTAGAILGALINYFLSMKLGRPFLYRYGKYFLLSPPTIERAEELFNRYGDLTTFVCRLLPAIRQLISIPAGLARMPIYRFILFTSLGAGIWSAILSFTGYYFASLAKHMSYAELVVMGKNTIHHQLPWLLLGLGAFVMVYLFIHHKIMKGAVVK